MNRLRTLLIFTAITLVVGCTTPEERAQLACNGDQQCVARLMAEHRAWQAGYYGAAMQNTGMMLMQQPQQRQRTFCYPTNGGVACQ